MTDYSRTQNGTVIKWALGGGILVCLAIALFVATTNQHPAGLIAVVVGAILIICWFLFSSLTVQVTRQTLRFYFGPGLIGRSISIEDIASAQAVRNHWIWGWGIRLTPHGWLYNVSGLDAVELHLKSGKKLRIGTDEPDSLLTAIKSALSANENNDEHDRDSQ